MWRQVGAAYCFQLANQLHQLLVIPLLLRLLPAGDVVLASKLLVSIAAIGILSDWGYGTIGAQHLYRCGNERRELRAVFERGEFARTCLWAAGCGLLFLVESVANRGIDSAALRSWALVVVGSLSWLLVPTWAVVGLREYGRMTPSILVLRIVSLATLALAGWLHYDVLTALAAYFSVMVAGSLVIRARLLGHLRLPFLPYRVRMSLWTELRPGGQLMLGAGLSFGFLSTGVYFADEPSSMALVASYVLADRILAAARAGYSPLVQYLVVGWRPNATAVALDARTTAAILLGCLITWGVTRSLAAFVFQDAQAAGFIDVLIVGFSFLGFSHYYVSLRLLGEGRTQAWLYVLLAAFGTYLLSILVLGNFSQLPKPQVVALSTVAAEGSVLVFGYSTARRRRAQIQ